MAQPTNSSWLSRFAFFTALTTLALIGLGGLVTSHEAGLAVPDWPNSYGYSMFFFPISQWVGGIFFEHSHRLVASFVGLLTTVLAVWLWAKETQGKVRWTGIAVILFAMSLLGVRKMPVYYALAGLAPVGIAIAIWKSRNEPGSLRWLGIIAFAAVILQGVLGGLRVVLLRDEIGIFHAALAQSFFVFVCIIAFLTTPKWRNLSLSPELDRRGLPFLYLATTALIFAQLILGATMRHQHAGLAIPDFPAAYGKIWPALDPQSIAIYNQPPAALNAAHPVTAPQIILQMAHRLVALLILISVGVCSAITRKHLPWQNPLTKLATLWFGLIWLQIGLGASTIWSNKSADIATGHVVVGALSLLTGSLLSLAARRVYSVRSGKNILAANQASANFIPAQATPCLSNNG